MASFTQAVSTAATGGKETSHRRRASHSAQARRHAQLASSSCGIATGTGSSSSSSSSFKARAVAQMRASPRAVGSWRRTAVPRAAAAAGAGGAGPLRAVVFDCDGVILESEDLHRQAYNATFHHFQCRCPGETAGPVEWSTDFYDDLQNKIGGGKPKMRWYFNKNGWPHSVLFAEPPTSEEDRTQLIDALQDWKTIKYQELIGSGSVPTRPGVLELMDEARALGLKVAVCSAATKSSVIFTLESLLGKERFDRLDCFMAGDDVPKKKPDPTIYKLAAERLGVSPLECVVVEDSVIGLQAASGAGMPCIITYTSSTKQQDFSAALDVLESLEGVTVSRLQGLLSGSSQPLSSSA